LFSSGRNKAIDRFLQLICLLLVEGKIIHLQHITMLGMKPTLVALALALALTVEVNAFGTVTIPKAASSRVFVGRSRLFMSDGDGSTMKSVKKQIVYDEKSGRFFESNKDEADCIPDEEFCVVDKESGAMIRLTVEEKERIFLDALQVSGQR
jgi:hypothetical protein